MPTWEWYKGMEGVAMCITNVSPDGVVHRFVTYTSNNGDHWNCEGSHLMWDGNLEKPTLTKSILHQYYAGREKGYIDFWHGYLRQGVFEIC